MLTSIVNLTLIGRHEFYKKLELSYLIDIKDKFIFLVRFVIGHSFHVQASSNL